MRGYLPLIAMAVLILVVLGAFFWIVQEAREALPRSDEIISVRQAADLIRDGEVARVLIQEERDVFLYLPDRARPLYTRLEPGTTFTETFQALGVPPTLFPPLTVEAD